MAAVATVAVRDFCGWVCLSRSPLRPASETSSGHRSCQKSRPGICICGSPRQTTQGPRSCHRFDTVDGSWVESCDHLLYPALKLEPEVAVVAKQTRQAEVAVVERCCLYTGLLHMPGHVGT